MSALTRDCALVASVAGLRPFNLSQLRAALPDLARRGLVRSVRNAYGVPVWEETAMGGNVLALGYLDRTR